MTRQNAPLGTALDDKFVAVLAVGRVDRRLIRRLDAGRGIGAENLIGTLADDIVAGKARERVECAIGKDVAAILDVLGGHADRNILQYRFQELLGRRQLSGKRALLAAILMRR